MQQKIYLASGSPRRHDLLREANIDFEYLKIDVEEIYPDDTPPREIGLYLAKLKAAEAITKVEDGIIITADTTVIVDHKDLGKPDDRDDAINTIRSIANRSHEVITGVCLTSPEKQVCFSASTIVYLHDLTEEEIVHYVDTYEPYDKAGSYGIQEWFGWVKIKRLEGSYANVMGLPVDEVYHALKAF